MSSGLIYAVIVALWAVVLVPIWLRRHDEVSETRSVDRFQGAMRTLSRRDPQTGDRREVLVPRRPRSRTVPDGAAPEITAASLALARRRRTGLVLTVLTVLVAGLGAAHVVPVWTALIPLLVLVGFVVQGRRSTRRSRNRDLADRRARAARARRERMAAVEAAEPMPTYASMAGTRRRESAEYAAAAADTPYDQDLVDEPAAGSVIARTTTIHRSAPPEPVAAEFYDAVAERVWEPVPVPLPTYVLAPKAPRSVRVIDLSLPGAWTSGRLDEGMEPTASPADVDAPAPSYDGIVTGEVLIERRAVGD